MLSNLVGESRAYRYAFPAGARSLCGLVGEQRAGTRPSRTRAGFAGSADAGDRVRVREVPSALLMIHASSSRPSTRRGPGPTT
jgi:hypothetical protein